MLFKRTIQTPKLIESTKEAVETKYYHDVIASNPLYSSTIAYKIDSKDYKLDLKFADNLLNNDFVNKDYYNLQNDFITLLSNQVPDLVTDKRFEQLCRCLLNEIKNLTDEQLINVLRGMLFWPNEELNELFFEICKELDNICLQRCKYWGIERCLFAMDHFYRLNVIRYSEFVWVSIGRLSNKISKLPTKQFLHLMFLAGTCRRWHPSINMYNVEYTLEQCLDELSIDEVAIVGAAFFKTQSKIHSTSLLDKIYVKLICNLGIRDLSSVTLSSLLKFARHSTPYESVDNMKNLMDVLVEKIDSVNLMCCVHIALLGTQAAVFHKETLKKVAQRLVSDINKARIKDIERIILSLATFNYNPELRPCVFETAIRELERPERNAEILQYSRPYVSALNYLAMQNVYSYYCINFVFSEEFLRSYCGKVINKFTVRPELLFLSNSILIERPDYNGNQLQPLLRASVCSHVSWKIPSEQRKTSRFERLFLDVKNILEQMYGEEHYIHPCYVLPHTSKPDIILCLRDEVAQVIPQEMRINTFEDMTQPPSNIGTWYCFLFLAKFLTINGTDEPLGIFLTKIRQLKQLNYVPVVIKQNEWNGIQTEKTRKEYVSKLIRCSTDEHSAV